MRIKIYFAILDLKFEVLNFINGAQIDMKFGKVKMCIENSDCHSLLDFLQEKLNKLPEDRQLGVPEAPLLGHGEGGAVVV